MKNILLVCSAGMSTSLLVTKMKEESKNQGIEAEIWANSEAEAKGKWEDADILVLGPPVKYLEGKMKEMVKDSIPVQVINMVDYGTMNGKKVLEQAIETLK